MNNPKRAFHKLMDKKGNYCQLCFLPIFRELRGLDSPIAGTIDHIIERRNRGTSLQSNLRLAHKFCNQTRKEYADPRRSPKYEENVLRPTMSYLNSKIVVRSDLTVMDFAS